MSKFSRRVRRLRRKVTKKLPIVGLAALGLVTAGVVTFAMTGNRAHDNTPTTYAQSATQPVAVPVKAETAAFLGDSYTAASNQGGGYVGPLVNAMGWTPLFFGQGGTGYVNPGQASEGESAFPARVDAVIAAAPDVVVVQGGLNDNNKAASLAAANQAFGDLRAGLPDARVIAVGPVLAPGMSAESIKAARDGIKEAAGAHGVVFIDPAAENWLPSADLFDVPGVHPTAEGYKRLGEHLVLAMKSQGIHPAA